MLVGEPKVANRLQKLARDIYLKLLLSLSVLLSTLLQLVQSELAKRQANNS
jgi:hypothetical protein